MCWGATRSIMNVETAERKTDREKKASVRAVEVVRRGSI
jgi:hypothetical protein